MNEATRAPISPANRDTGGEADPLAVPATNRLTLGLIFALGLALTVFRAPATYELLAANVPPEMSGEIKDPQLEGLALKTAVFAGVVLTAFALAIFLAVAARLERHLFSAAHHIGPLRVGAFCLTIAICFIGFHVQSIAMPPTAPGSETGAWAMKAGVGLLVPLLFIRELRQLPRGRILCVLAASGLLGLLTSVG